jgi:hypothetical protein
MNSKHKTTFILVVFAASSAWGQTSSSPILAKEIGTKALSQFQADIAPGAVSATSLLGLSGDQVSAIENPRDLTVTLKAFDGSNTFGLSITPARTSLTPMELKSYSDSVFYRVLGATTLSYAQASATVDDKKYRQLAYAIESSFYLNAERDDPLLVYWLRLKSAKADGSAPCSELPASQPIGPSIPAPGGGVQNSLVSTPSAPVVPGTNAQAKEVSDALASLCRAEVEKGLRWNRSRAWASLASGSIKPFASGGFSHSLGRTFVLGITYGFGNQAAGGATTPEANGGALTLGYKRTSNEPVAATYQLANPTLKNARIVTLRGAFGSNKLRGLVEASNVRDELPTASERVFRRALGLDVRLSEGIWLNVRAGKQRRIDNAGDESGASFGLSYSPAALLKL